MVCLVPMEHWDCLVSLVSMRNRGRLVCLEPMEHWDRLASLVHMECLGQTELRLLQLEHRY